MKQFHHTHKHWFAQNLMRTALLSLCLAGSMSISAKQYTLFKNGKSKYAIVVASNASETEKTAASELQQYLQQISGATLPIRNSFDSQKGYQLVIGQKPANAKALEQDEDFAYQNEGSNLFIYGGQKRGTMYGVFTFLENELGVRWYTPTTTKVPQQKSWSFSELNHSEHPTVQLRQNDYFLSAQDDAWNAHNKMNMTWNPHANKYGGLVGYWSCHTIPHFVPYSLFDKHPEYFCMKNGVRKTNGQFCLSNPEVLQLCKEGMLKQMRDHQDYQVYSLSQADNFEFCECEKCKAIEDQYGGHSGLMIWFVNQVADYVRDQFPDKYVGTFAYQYTRKPCSGIRPKDNVVIRLCSIECCFAHPFETADCKQNEDFMNDLKAWSQIAPHLFIWDYIVDYAQYMAPWPNFQVLAPNIRTLRDNHAIGVYEESQYQSPGGEFDEMKAWVLSHLMWNPDQSEVPLVQDFIKGFYGQAAPQIQAYYDLCQSLVTKDKHYGIYINAQNAIYSDEFISQADAILAAAKNAAENDEIRSRVERVSMQILYMKVARNYKESKQNGIWNEFIRLARKYEARVNEGETLDAFIANKKKEYGE